MVITNGFFDGVHTGHRLVIERLVSEARKRGEESLVITFWPHPRLVLQDGAVELRLLTSLEEKIRLIRSLGVDRVEVIEFTKEFSGLTAEEYLKEYVMDKFGGTTLLLGYDHRLGSDGKSVADISDIASGLGLDVVRVDRTPDVVSSTLIRAALSRGDVRTAGEMLGRGYVLSGVVVSGNRLGHTIGFPTANMRLYDPLKLIPANGVYSVEVETAGRHMRGMCNVGVRPTVGNAGIPTIETNIFNFDQEIYGLDISVRFLEKIRDEKKFPSLQALSEQLAKDKLIAASCPVSSLKSL